MSTQCIQTTRQPEPIKILVESTPVKERRKLLMNSSWEDIQGLAWIFQEDWS
ncbi:MAG: hypothetical protein ACE5RG_03275 [Candidatus Nitrosomaritimum yanchengensis]